MGSFFIEPSTEGIEEEDEAWGSVVTEKFGDGVDERRLIRVLRFPQIAVFLVNIGYK